MICTSYGTTDVAIPMQLELQQDGRNSFPFSEIWLKPQRRLCPFDWVLLNKSSVWTTVVYFTFLHCKLQVFKFGLPTLLWPKVYLWEILPHFYKKQNFQADDLQSLTPDEV